MLNKKHDPYMPRVPLWKKMNLTVEEAAEYSGIGVSKIKKTVPLSYGMEQSG